jgi:PAS domain S-box-containing protein
MHGSGGNVDRPPNEETPERGEDALRESDALFRATFEQAAVGLSHNAPDGRWLRVNDKLCEITGYSREELTSGMTFQDITHPDDLEADVEHAQRLWAGEIDTYSMQKRYLRKDASVVWIELTVAVVRDEEGHPLYWLGVQYDITEQKRAEEALRGVREAERRRLARDLHDGVLQDLSYTTAVMGLIMLDAEGTSMEEELQRAVDAVRRAAQGLRDAVNDLRLEEEVDRPFPQLVDSLVERSRSMDPGCDISLRVEEGFPSEPLGDVGVELSRVVREALTNARRHSGASSVRVMLWTEEGNLLAEVADDGRGFAAGSAPGVGLRSMRERALQLGGDLEVESALGEGTRVRVRAPMMHAALGGAPRGETGVDGEGR